MIQIIPAILSTKEEDFKRDVERYNNSEIFKDSWIHIDFMDNEFVPNQSVDPSVLAKYPTSLQKEAHPMVAHPLDWVDKLESVGFKRIIFHIEAKDDITKTIQYIKSKGLGVGLALKADTPIERLEPFVDKIDLVLVMSIVPGFQGQPFVPESLEKIKEIYSLRSKKNLPFTIGVDGHINDETVKKVVEAGAEHLIVGSFLLKGDIDENVEKIWEAIQEN